MGKYLHKRHNVTVLLYHIVCPAKYRRAVFTAEVEQELKVVCKEIEARYEIGFLEIGADRDQVHFLVQSVPSYSSTKIVRIVKSLTAREIFARVPSVKKQLWGGEFWSKGYFMASVGQHGNESVIANDVKGQDGGEYRRLDVGGRRVCLRRMVCEYSEACLGDIYWSSKK
jgi:putative transposase